MTIQNATVRHQLQFGLGAPTAAGGVFPVTRRLALDQCDVGEKPTLITTDDEMRGALAHRSEPTAAGLKPTSGTIAWRPRPDELVDVLPLIFGGTFAGTILEPAFITQGFPFSFDRKVKVMNSTGCKVARTEFSSQPGQSLRLSMQLEALSTAIANAGTFPALSLSTMQPFQHHHSVLTFASTARLINSVKIGVDNGLDTSRFNNAQTRSELPQNDRSITVSFDTPFTTDEYDLYTLAAAGSACTVVYTNGTVSLSFSFPCLQAAAQAPGAPGGRQEMGLRMDTQAKSVNGSAITAEEVKITLVSTL